MREGARITTGGDLSFEDFAHQIDSAEVVWRGARGIDDQQFALEVGR